MYPKQPVFSLLKWLQIGNINAIYFQFPLRETSYPVAPCRSFLSCESMPTAKKMREENALRNHELWKNTVFSTHLRTPHLWDSKCSGKVSPTKRNQNTWPTYTNVTNKPTISLKKKGTEPKIQSPTSMWKKTVITMVTLMSSPLFPVPPRGCPGGALPMRYGDGVIDVVLTLT